MENKEVKETINYDLEIEKLNQTINQMQNYIQQLELTIRVLSNLINRG